MRKQKWISFILIVSIVLSLLSVSSFQTVFAAGKGKVTKIVSNEPTGITQEEGALDVARAVRFIRKNAKVYKIDKKDIALMGFSAGGIQVGEELRHFKGKATGKKLDKSYKPDKLDKISANAAACGEITTHFLHTDLFCGCITDKNNPPAMQGGSSLDKRNSKL